MVHGALDDTVPVAMSRALVARRRTAGDEIEYVELRVAGHYEQIDPRTDAWKAARSWLASRWG